MNKFVGLGRMTKDVDVTYAGQDKQTAVGRFSVAIQRKVKNAQGQYDADFINCVAFGKTAEFISQYFSKGSRIAFEGRIQTGSYTNKEGQKVYTTDVVIETFPEFVDSKSEKPQNTAQVQTNDGFINIPDSVESEGLPFN